MRTCEHGWMRWCSSGIYAELLGAGWGVALVAVLLTLRWEYLGSSPGVDLLDFSLLFFDFGFQFTEVLTF